jgi:peptide/nickel transport system permease protein
MRLFGAKLNITAAVGFAIVGVYLIAVVFAPLIAPYGQDNITDNADPWIPDSQHWLGLDNLGRDIFSRLIFGLRLSVGLSLIMTVLAFLIGVIAGFAAAVAGGWLDTFLSRLVDLLLSMPQLIFALVILSALGSSLTVLVPTIAIVNSPIVFRLARAVAMSVVSLEFVEAARVRGEGWWWIVTREIMPNSIPPLVAEFGLRFTFTFLLIASLSFLGLGVQPPYADLGGMVKDYAEMINYGVPEAPIYPAATIAILTIGVNFIVDWMLALHSKGHGEGA